MLETTETLHSKHVAYYMCHKKKKKLEKIFTFDFYFRNSVWIETLAEMMKEKFINSICTIYFSPRYLSCKFSFIIKV